MLRNKIDFQTYILYYMKLHIYWQQVIKMKEFILDNIPRLDFTPKNYFDAFCQRLLMFFIQEFFNSKALLV